MEDLDKYIINYDKSKYKFNSEFSKINSIKFKDSDVDLKPSLIYINNIAFEYNIVGRFDDITNIWEWGWVNEFVKNKVYFINQLLRYSIEVVEEKNALIKNILNNSKIQITNKINIDIILAITLKFLSSFGFTYIHTVKESSNIYTYYILKQSK
jgi:hypothetical protein